MSIKSNPSRITDLDCMRGLAIIMVVFYHYFSRWESFQLYPKKEVGELFFFKYGYLGVELFFIISGFVIFLTLERSSNFIIFIRNRLIRLLPLLIVCSIITFLTIKLITNKYFTADYLDFLPSLTFVDPIFWRLLLQNSSISFIDGVYWSLLVEMKYYLLVGGLYFIFKDKFLSTWLFTNVIILIISLTGLLLDQINSNLFQLFRLIFFSEFYSYFSFGMIFYLIYTKREISVFQKVLICNILILHSLVYLNIPEILFLLLCLLFFYFFVTGNKIFKILPNKFFLFLGGISYPLYLLHQNIGVLLIGKINLEINSKSIFVYIVPFFVFGVLIVLAWFMHNYFDVILQKKLKQYVNTKKIS